MTPLKGKVKIQNTHSQRVTKSKRMFSVFVVNQFSKLARNPSLQVTQFRIATHMAPGFDSNFAVAISALFGLAHVFTMSSSMLLACILLVY